MVNSAVVSYFMENLKLVGHFETLKKFLFMEDGEFSFSLTQQLFEKVRSYQRVETEGKARIISKSRNYMYKERNVQSKKRKAIRR